MLPHQIKAILCRRLDAREDMPFDMKLAIKNHERVDLFTANMAKTLTDIDVQYKNKYNRVMSKKTIEEIVNSFADQFADGVIGYESKNRASVLQKAKDKAERDRLEALEKAAETGELTGEYAELKGGVKVNGTITKEEKESNKA